MFWRKRKHEEPADEVKVAKAGGGVYIVTVRGQMSASLFKRLEQAGAKELEAVGTVKILWDLEQFEGWKGAPGDGNIDFLLKYDAQIEKIAVVGDSKWKDPAMTFLGAGYRKAEVRFFPTNGMDEAKGWLKE